MVMVLPTQSAVEDWQQERFELGSGMAPAAEQPQAPAESAAKTPTKVRATHPSVDTPAGSSSGMCMRWWVFKAREP